MSKRRGKMRGDVQWFLPKRKRAFASSTVATSDLIEVLSEEGRTIRESYDFINYDEDAKSILKVYIDNGYGDVTFHNVR